MKLTGAEIAEATGGTLLVDAPDGEIQTDTRRLAEDSWFLALKGDRFDAWDFLEQAQKAGALGCIVSRPPPSSWRSGVVLVQDTTRALQDLGRWVRSRLDVPVVALTGSSGKTTTRAFIALALSPRFRVHQTVGNLNNHLGVPMTLLATPEDAEALVVEMGTSSPGEIQFLAELARPTVRVVINVGAAHLEELGGLDGVAVEKGALLRTGLPGDVAVVNADDSRVLSQPIPEGVRRITWGQDVDADVCVMDCQLVSGELASDCTWRVDGQTVSATLPVAGEHMAHNAGAALAVAKVLGVPGADAARALQEYEPVGMRMRAEALPHGATALNDAYNANPQSMSASLKLLCALPGRSLAVLGDMLELGPDEALFHEAVVQEALALGVERLVLVGPRMSAAAHVAGVDPRVWAAEEGESLAAELRSELRPGDHVLFKGSRGARVERILQSVRDDAERGVE